MKVTLVDRHRQILRNLKDFLKNRYEYFKRFLKDFLKVWSVFTVPPFRHGFAVILIVFKNLKDYAVSVN